MKSKKFSAIVLATLVAGALIAPAGIAEAKKKAPKGPLVVGTDVEGDWGSDNPSGEDISQVGAEGGMDLLEASIGVGEPGVLNFVIKVSKLPSSGGIPEIPRYIWGVSVDGEYIELDGKYTNYSRGACDPTAGTCPPPRDPGQQPFLIRGTCVTDATVPLTTCQELGVVQGVFDAAAGTITIPVPLEMINAKPGSKIAPGMSDFNSQGGGTILAIPSAFVSRTDMPRDGLLVTETFTVPKK